MKKKEKGDKHRPYGLIWETDTKQVNLETSIFAHGDGVKETG